MYVFPVQLASCVCLQERNAAVIRAEGESESARLISDATKNFGSGLIELRRIEVSVQAQGCISHVCSWAGGMAGRGRAWASNMMHLGDLPCMQSTGGVCASV